MTDDRRHFKLNFSSGNGPSVASTIALLRAKDEIESIQVGYHILPSHLTSGESLRLIPGDLAKSLFEALCDSPFKVLSMGLERSVFGNHTRSQPNHAPVVFPVGYRRGDISKLDVRVMMGHFLDGIGDSLRQHPTLQNVQLLVDDTDGWGDLLSGLGRCTHLKRVTLQFARRLETGTEKKKGGLQIGKVLAPLVERSNVTRLVLLAFPFLGDLPLRRTFHALKGNMHLKELYITKQGCTWNASLPMVKSIAQALEANSTLEVLRLPIDCAESAPIIKALESNRSLRVLSLRGDGKKSEISGALASMLRANKTLEDLGLFLSIDCTLPIVEALKSNRSLRELRLSGGDGNVSNEAANNFASALKAGCVLENAPWSYNSESNPIVTIYIKLNRAGRGNVLVPSTVATRKEWMDAILYDPQDTQYVHFLLSQNPSLCSYAILEQPGSVIDRPKKRQRMAYLSVVC